MPTLDSPLFAQRRVHLIGISESLNPRPAVARLLSHAGFDPRRVVFVDGALVRSPMVADLELRIPCKTEALVILDAPALVGYKVRSRERTFKVMVGLRQVALDSNRPVIGVTKTNEYWHGRQRIAGSTAWGEVASTVATVDPGSTADTIAVWLKGPNLQPQKFELALSLETGNHSPIPAEGEQRLAKSR